MNPQELLSASDLRGMRQEEARLLVRTAAEWVQPMKRARRPSSQCPVPAGTRRLAVVLQPHTTTHPSLLPSTNEIQSVGWINSATHARSTRGSSQMDAKSQQRGPRLQALESASSQVEKELHKKSSSLDGEPVATFIHVPPCVKPRRFEHMMDRLSCFWQRKPGFSQEQNLKPQQCHRLTSLVCAETPLSRSWRWGLEGSAGR